MTQCKVIEDLLPLYEEDLLQPETKAWVNEHLTACSSCSKKIGVELTTLPTAAQPEKSADKMMAQAQLKLTIYQLLFVALSFLFAMSTSLFSNNGFHFILTYFILGAVTFYFYRSWLLTILLAAIPIAIWTIVDTIYSYGSINRWLTQSKEFYNTTIQIIWNVLIQSITVALIHTIFAILGIIFIQCLLLAFKKRGETL